MTCLPSYFQPTHCSHSKLNCYKKCDPCYICANFAIVIYFVIYIAIWQLRLTPIFQLYFATSFKCALFLNVFVKILCFVNSAHSFQYPLSPPLYNVSDHANYMFSGDMSVSTYPLYPLLSWTQFNVVYSAIFYYCDINFASNQSLSYQLLTLFDIFCYCKQFPICAFCGDTHVQ